MGNCLKTQLKEQVNNPNLLKMNEMRMKMTSKSDSNYLLFITDARGSIAEFHFDKEVSVKIGSGAVQTGTDFATDGTSYTAVQVYIPINNGVTTLSIPNKDVFYNIQDDGVCDTIEFSGLYNPNLDNFWVNLTSSVTGVDLKSIANVAVLFGIPNITGALEDLKNTNMTQLHLNHCNISGSVESLIDKTDLLSVELNCQNIIGVWENVFNAWAQAGKNTADMLVVTGSASFNNSTSNQELKVSFGNGMVNPTAEDTARGWQWKPLV